MVLPCPAAGKAQGWLEDEEAGTYPEVGGRDGVWGDLLPLLRAFLLDTDAIARDRSRPCVDGGLPLQHQGGGPHFGCLHIIRGACGGGMAEMWGPGIRATSWAVRQQAGQVGHYQAWKGLLQAQGGPGQPWLCGKAGFWDSCSLTLKWEH